MKEVACRSLDFIFSALKKKGVPPERLVVGTPYPVSHFRNKHEWIEWEVFVKVMANASTIWNQTELLSLAPGFLKSPFVRPVYAAARLLFSTRDVYRFVIGDEKGASGQMFPCIKNRYTEIGVDRVELELTLPEGYPLCPEFFLISIGVFTNIPGLLGLPDADVRMTDVPNGVRYAIKFPVDTGVIPAVRRAITWPFAARSVARELKDTHLTLQARYRELEDYRLNLEKKVEERTAELQKARDELAETVLDLKSAQESRDLLFANINHEIRTPLSLVILAASEVLRRDGDKLGARSRAELDNIERATRRLLRLVDELLVLAAGQEGRLHIQPEVTDVAVLLGNVVTLWRTSAEAQGLSLSYDGPQSARAQVDSHAFDRVITNLISNAIKFTPNGGSIQVNLEQKPDEIEVTVRDTGIGIDDEFRRRIFGRFEQGRSAVRAGTHGSGVGLSIVKQLVEAHGGTIVVESPGHGGTLFRMRFPTRQPIRLVDAGNASRAAAVHSALRPEDFGIDAPASAPEVEVTGPAGGVAASATILVAEDDPLLRGSIARLLSEEYRVVVAKDGISALQLARTHRPDLLVTDVGMPGMDGLELTRRFRALDGNRLAPVVLLTAFGTLRDRLEGFDAGAIDHVSKPFAPEELKARIRSQLALRALALRLNQSEKLAGQGVLAAGLAHELRNPANGIVNAIAPLKELLPSELLEAGQPVGQLLDVIEHCSTQVEHLAKQLLGLRGGGEIARTRETFASILSRSFALVGAAFEKVKLRNECDFVGTLFCAAPTVTQVIANLLENGAHAAGPGGWVRIATSVVEAGAGAEGRVLVFEVTDSGPGVPLDLRERIFEPFFTTKAPGVGTGLGLTTAREIARRHEGSLDVLPTATGTAFHFRLPLDVLASDTTRSATR